MLFEEKVRKREGPLRRGERFFSFYDEAGGPAYDALRETLNSWTGAFPEGERTDLYTRLRDTSNREFQAALLETVAHRLLSQLTGRVPEIHPPLTHTAKVPDFGALGTPDNPGVFVEVTTINQPHAVEAEVNIESAIYNAIDRIALPSGVGLRYQLVRASPATPRISQIGPAVEEWANENKDKVAGGETVRVFIFGDWKIELELFPVQSSGSLFGRAIGIASMRGGAITPARDIRAALDLKAKRYGRINAPYLIVVGDCKDQLRNNEAARQTLTEAVFGDERVEYVGGLARFGFGRNGFWRGITGARNKQVSGVLLFPRVDIWKLREPNAEPILAVNPWADHPLPATIEQLQRFKSDGSHWRFSDGRALGDILALPTNWPPT